VNIVCKLKLLCLSLMVLFLTSCGTSKTHNILAPADMTSENQLSKTEYINSVGMEFVYIPAGTFIMGSPVTEELGLNDETQHRVTLTKGFYMQKTEVTVGQWRDFVSTTKYRTEAETNGGAFVLTKKKYKKKPGKYWDNPDFSQTEQHPVTCLSWNDAQVFVKWLNQMEDNVYRLPTEAEWEYACRAGTETPFSFGKCLSTDRANFDCNYPLPGCETQGSYLKKTAPVARFAPNNWGLHDMHGNVWEWCQDWWGLYPPGPVVDPKGPSSGTRWRPTRISRGGSWLFGARRCRSAYRYKYPPGDSDDNLGFRLVMNPSFPVSSARR